MSYETPILTAGVPSAQSIYETVTDARHEVGTRGCLTDGRVFRYAENRSTAIAVGLLVASPAISVDYDDLATNTAAVGDTSVTVTPVGSATYAANELVGGFLCINSGTTGAGHQYRITGHAAIAAATATAINCEPIRVAFNADTTATVVPNAYGGVTVAPTTVATVVGATQYPIPVGTDADPVYSWVQTWGPASVAAGAAGDVIGHTLVKDTTTAGEFLGFVDGATDVTQIIGTNRLGVTISADYTPIFLTIAP